MEFNPFPDLLNTGFTVIETGLFCGGEHLGAKIYRFPTLFDKITSKYRFLVGTKLGMTIELSSSNVLLKH